MKKIILLFSLAILFSCTSSDDSESAMSDNNYNPPSWIQGVWIIPNVPVTSGFEFRDSDFCLASGNVTTCYEQTYSQVTDFNVYEEISNTRYLTITTIAGSEYRYEFEKVSENSIKWLNVNGSNNVNVTLVKQ
ncbi:hypothetical protein [uncultured Polaribacter sp.]|uniref:hypothetical protein n=1 Tax=uncultured Polaribacter sp. TaxID=174711 RepID=UPI002611F836|nr:hypothetical protein [uncultured Polaribacter sp.]